ncbi:FecR family protein [Pontibacter silvestris]|uniref:FecR family protein n=1 Tax=Pontibacter silvestris TaxID=2305183 RepID=A0ABW4X090_9BACT|nr:FecR domain-containing protein [Pontibacter silvestris]MCC9137565.1 FecR domain-containing protein [Pontibacter silvestris]
MNKEQYWKQAFYKYLKGEASQRESKTIDKFFLHLKQDNETVWKEVGEPAEEIRNRIQRKLTVQPEAEKPFPAWYSVLTIKVAASFLLVLGLSFLFYLGFKGSTSAKVQTSQFISVVVAPGEQKEVVLPDGSLVKLNSDSELKYSASDFNQQERRVYLNGEAFFKVKQDTIHAFVVETKGLTTRVLGTSFNINTHDREHAVTVATGLVEVCEKITGQSQHVLLCASEKACFNETAGKLEKLQYIAANDYAWTNRSLVFNKLPIDKAIAKIERWYGVQITYDAGLSERTITARYDNEPLKHVVQSVCFLLDLTCEKTASGELKLQHHPTL